LEKISKNQPSVIFEQNFQKKIRNFFDILAKFFRMFSNETILRCFFCIFRWFWVCKSLYIAFVLTRVKVGWHHKVNSKDAHSEKAFKRLWSIYAKSHLVDFTIESFHLLGKLRWTSYQNLIVVFQIRNTLNSFHTIWPIVYISNYMTQV
jgi:hypothetical protein